MRTVIVGRDLCYYVARMDGIANVHADVRQPRVAGGNAAAVIDLEHEAVYAALHVGDYDAVGRRGDLGVFRSGNVYPVMELGPIRTVIGDYASLERRNEAECVSLHGIAPEARLNDVILREDPRADPYVSVDAFKHGVSLLNGGALHDAVDIDCGTDGALKAVAADDP